MPADLLPVEDTEEKTVNRIASSVGALVFIIISWTIFTTLVKLAVALVDSGFVWLNTLPAIGNLFPLQPLSPIAFLFVSAAGSYICAEKSYEKTSEWFARANMPFVVGGFVSLNALVLIAIPGIATLFSIWDGTVMDLLDNWALGIPGIMGVRSRHKELANSQPRGQE